MTRIAICFLSLHFLPVICGFGNGWRVSLNIGREPGSPLTWANSGARLPIVVKCDFEADTKMVVPKSEEIRFTASGGEVVKPVQGGTWSLTNDRDLKFSLKFPDDVVKNDVKIDAGTTLTMEGLLYSKKDLEELNQRFYAAREEEWKAMDEIDEIQRRQDAPKKWNPATNRWEKRYTLEPISTQLSKRLKLFEKEQKRKLEDSKRPLPRDLSTNCGPFPGVDGDVYVALGGKIRCQGVRGTWCAEPILASEVTSLTSRRLELVAQ